MTKRDFAKGIYDRIGDGHLNAVARPDDETIDRYLRDFISHANCNGDCIISGCNGYYRPIPGDPVDEAERIMYMKEDRAKFETNIERHECMNAAWDARVAEAAFAQGKSKERQCG